MEGSFVKREKKQKKLSWTDEDKRFLKDNYHLLSVEDLAKILSKTLKQVRKQASNQYLTKKV